MLTEVDWGSPSADFIHLTADSTSSSGSRLLSNSPIATHRERSVDSMPLSAPARRILAFAGDFAPVTMSPQKESLGAAAMHEQLRLGALLRYRGVASLRVAHGTQAVSRLGECGHQDSEARPRGRPNERPMPMPSESHQVSEWVRQETDASRVQQCPG